MTMCLFLFRGYTIIYFIFRHFYFFTELGINYLPTGDVGDLFLLYCYLAIFSR